MASSSLSSPPLFRLFYIISIFLLIAPLPSLTGPVATEFIYPNFNASYIHFVDSDGVFLSSSAFSAALHNPGPPSRYYLVVLHAPSGTVVWTANPATPLPSSASLVLTANGLSLVQPDGSSAWSTPRLSAPAVALQLLPSGELRLLDAANASLWSSFNFPTDTLLPNQLLPVSAFLSSAVSDSNPSPGDYRLLVTPSDAVLQWTPTSQVYWSLASDLLSVKDSNLQVAYLSVNATGLHLFAGDRKTAVFVLIFPPPPSSFPNEFHIAKLDSAGRLRIRSFSPNRSLSAAVFDTDFLAPRSDCDLPSFCGLLGLCTPAANSSNCGCAPSFGASSPAGCSPADGSIMANSSCRDDHVGAGGMPFPSYMSLGSRIGYFGTKFSSPTTSGANLSACRDLCSGNCSCVGFFYKNSSKSCFLFNNQIGSLFAVNTASGEAPPAGYIKIFDAPPPSDSSSSARFIIVFLPTAATILLAISISVICFALWRRNKGMMRTKSITSGLRRSMTAEFSDHEAEKEEEIWIPGLPTRYTYAELEVATNNFATHIGTGGFGSVYKGQLPDKSLVAVKRINAVSNQHGRKEFYTEIAVIGNIHHVNLVRLRGFCAQGPKRLLVYEYMDRGSLDRALFGRGPALEWRERVDIAVGAARGLAYLHAGCDHRIIHCDVKPENILLHGRDLVKIADFGLAKLMSPEQSGFFTTMRGTRGYLAPEWLTNSAISDKTDVYSFGMVLLEIVRGRKNRAENSEPVWSGSTGSSGRPRPAPYFPMLALEMHERGTYEQLADPRLEGRVSAPEVERMVKVALCCLHEEPASRASMTAVAAMLQGTMAVGEPRLESLDYLRLYGRGSRDPKVRGLATSSGSSMSPLLSYVSSQEVSGPR
ncbi:hypothetical protein Cni_G21659 [Canna indica]|uniref:Receptor-like serine/threonine-protein kinase n=1 Tax=Canna indica TaxID=4628 RepID=A0AAQ3QHI6_9LILI|nr:hypothetical protein Cni_G21659 [Canna indica]